MAAETTVTTLADDDATSADVTRVEGRLGRFVVLRLLGQGATGVVYSAYDELLARRVALKLVRTDVRGSSAHTRILHEAQALARLSHPNVVQVYEVSAAAGRVFIAMEYVEGATLRQWTADRQASRADRRELLDMYIQAGRGLAAAHAGGLVHRDFKPDNVLVGADGRARVVDFGLVTAPAPSDARADDPDRLHFTADGAILGTPAYMPPEQFAGRPADARSDQFSFCVALYEALCGTRPFAGDTFAALHTAVADGAVRPLPPDFPAWLAALLRRGLATDPADRFSSMSELLAGLASDPAVTRRQRRRVATLVAAIVLGTVVLVLAAVALRQRWSDYTLERSAERARASAEARIVEARAAGDRAAADQAFAAFVDDPLHEGTDAAARAWLGEAGRRTTDGDRPRARAALAAAYLGAADSTLQATALVGLARQFHASLETDALAQVLTLLATTAPDVAATPELAAMHVDVALARHDLAAARTLLAAGPPSPTRRLVDALAGATATAHRGITQVHFNRTHALLLEDRNGQHVLHVARRDPALTPLHTTPLPTDTAALMIVAEDPFLAVVHAEDTTSALYSLDAAGATVVHRWTDGGGNGAVVADLDGDGVRELYVGIGRTLDMFTPQPDGAWTRDTVYDAIDSLDSTAAGLHAVDLDGDGREELAAAFTNWRAFDVRVLRREPGSVHLHTLARDKLGNTLDLASLRGADERLLVANNCPMPASPLVFAPDRVRGDPPGLYLYALTDDHLTRRRHLALPAGATHEHVVVGDADGDGHDDVAVDHAEPGRHHTLLQLQHADGAFTPITLGHLELRALAQLDDDPAHELVVDRTDTDGHHALWVVGAGTDTLPPHTPPSPDTTSLVDPDDAAWTRQASHAAGLQRLGLHADAAAAFQSLARRSPHPDLRARAFLQAATLVEVDGHHRDAESLYGNAAADPTLAQQALEGVLRAQLRLGAYDEASRTVAAVQALPGVDEPTRAALTRRHGRLASASQDRIDLDFREPLAPAWDLVDPLALRREPDGLALTTSAPGTLMALPVAWSGDLLELTADITLHHSEWSNLLEISLVPIADPTAPPLARVTALSSGTSRGGVDVIRLYACRVDERWIGYDGAPEVVPTGTDNSIRLEMRVSATPELGEVGCEVHEHAAPLRRHDRRPHTAPLPPAGDYLLIVRLHNDIPAWLDARLHSITVRGARPATPHAPADPRRHALQRALVGAADLVAALAILEQLPTKSPREQVWQADTLLQLGRLTEADSVWSTLLPATPSLEPALGARLRAAPALYGPHLRALDPAGHPARLHAVWRNAAVNHLGDPRTRAAMATALAPLDIEASLAAARDDIDRGHLVDLLGWRARLSMHMDEPTRAQSDLERALTIAESLTTAIPPRTTRWLLWIELATLAAARGDQPRARDAIRRAYETGDMPLLVSDVVRARPSLASLATE